MRHSAIPFALRDIDPEQGKVLECDLQPGLYAFTVEADASRFAWEDLYIVLNVYGNVDQRTGPWDFDLLNNNRPVLPAYWVFLDGGKIGLWYFNRPSSRQIEERRFRGELSFRIASAGRHTIEFQPYRAFRIEWKRVELQPEPFDRFEPASHIYPDLIEQVLPARMPANQFTQGYLDSVTWAKQQVNTDRNSGFQLPILAAAWRWSRDAEALAAARKVIEAYLNLPVWGNPREDGYGHNGDMAAATPLFGIAVALRWLGQDVDDLRERILAKLQMQGDIFLKMALLQRGYWGGSILQDHGFVSFAWFTCAAYVLQDILPAARDWLAFGVPRMKRSLAAMPRDGIVPVTSYHSFWMYVDKLVLFRELHRLATGEDIYERDCVRAIPHAVRSCHDPASNASLSPCGDSIPMDGGQAYLAQMAHDADAQWLLAQFFRKDNLLRKRSLYCEWHIQKDWLWALLFRRRPPVTSWRYIQKDLVEIRSGADGVETHWFRDSGVVAIRDACSLVVGACGLPNSIKEHATCPCDRIMVAPLSGNFGYLHSGRQALQTAGSAYRMSTSLGNVLLVDGRGQKGDCGMPMSYPDAEDHGERIVRILDDGSGYECDLTPAYDGLDAYTRRIRLLPAGGIEIADTVACTGPHSLRWLFQSDSRNTWTQLGNGNYELRIDGQRHLASIEATGCGFATSVAPTPSVWGYSQTDRLTCHHLAIDAVDAGNRVNMRFTLRALGCGT